MLANVKDVKENHTHFKLNPSRNLNLNSLNLRLISDFTMNKKLISIIFFYSLITKVAVPLKIKQVINPRGHESAILIKRQFPGNFRRSLTNKFKIWWSSCQKEIDSPSLKFFKVSSLLVFTLSRKFSTDNRQYDAWKSEMGGATRISAAQATTRSRAREKHGLIERAVDLRELQARNNLEYLIL